MDRSLYHARPAGVVEGRSQGREGRATRGSVPDVCHCSDAEGSIPAWAAAHPPAGPSRQAYQTTPRQTRPTTRVWTSSGPFQSRSTTRPDPGPMGSAMRQRPLADPTLRGKLIANPFAGTSSPRRTQTGLILPDTGHRSPSSSWPSCDPAWRETHAREDAPGADKRGSASVRAEGCLAPLAAQPLRPAPSAGCSNPGTISNSTDSPHVFENNRASRASPRPPADPEANDRERRLTGPI